MREIKFRAFYKPENTMLNWDFLQTELDHYEKPLVSTDDYKVMQYTGIKDKNGVEIYEGDVVQFPYITPFGDITDKDGFVKVVEYENGSFGFRNSIDFDPMQEWFKKEKGEYIPNAGNKVIYKYFIGKVIGNIYQDSELLEK